jgi:uncharacterized glyoxalase superfamily protein PhnB
MTTYPILRYRDARAAIAWLADAFGLTEKQICPGEDGTIAHAELHSGEGLIMLSTDRDDDSWGRHAGQGWVYVAVKDPDALHERAVAAGAEITYPLQDTDYGSRDFSANDLEGNRWSFGTYAP